MQNNECLKAPRASSLSENEKRCASRKDELEMAITTVRGLLHYHQRMCLVSEPSYMADTYEISLVTALECLKKELIQIS